MFSDSLPQKKKGVFSLASQTDAALSEILRTRICLVESQHNVQHVHHGITFSRLTKFVFTISLCSTFFDHLPCYHSMEMSVSPQAISLYKRESDSTTEGHGRWYDAGSFMHAHNLVLFLLTMLFKSS
jgi:hypothetical protein